MAAQLTAAALAAHDAEHQNKGASPLPEELLTAAVEGLDPVEVKDASAARHAHLAALQKEYDTLAALSADEASGWADRRERQSACAIQSAWRRHAVRASFVQAIHISLLQRRHAAASVIQRAQRTRRRVVSEAAPPISRETVQKLVQQISERTLRMAGELSDALKAEEEWAAFQEGDKPELPQWVDKPAWRQDLDDVGGSSVVHQLRGTARRGFDSRVPKLDVLRGVEEWPALRASVQGAAVRRQVVRTQAASLHAQLLHPPPLPPVPRAREGARGVDEVLPPVAAGKPAVQAAHRRSLQQARLAVEAEEEEDVLAAPSPLGKPSPGRSPGRARAQDVERAQRALRRLTELAGVDTTGVSSAEMVWLASLEDVGVSA